MHILLRPTRILAAGLVLFLFALGLQLLLAQHSPAEASVGPKRSIKCPPKAVKIGPGANIQRAINRRPRGTAFCLRPGVYKRRAPITPKSGNRFIGRYGAIIDGSGWKTSDPNQGLFRAHNQDIDRVVIRNLVIRNSPQRGIHAFMDHSDRWLIEHNDIRDNRVGISHGNHFVIRRNVIRRNWQYGIGGYRSTGSVIQRNRFTRNALRFRDFPMNSGTSKWAQVTNTIVQGNTVVDNHHNGIWFDGGHRGIVIARNTVRRNGGNGIFSEVGGSTVIRDNTVMGHHRGIYISESHDTTVTGNTLRNNDRAIWLFQDGNRRSQSELGNNVITGNRMRVPNKPVVAGVTPAAAGLNCSNLTATQCAVYSVSRGNLFQGNAYTVPNANAKYWNWENTARSWSEWRGGGQDTRGTLKVG